MRVAFAPIARIRVEVDASEEFVEVSAVYSWLARRREEAAIYPGSRLAWVDPRLSMLERGYWEILLAGSVLAPILAEVVDAQSFRPLQGLQWRLAAKSFAALRSLYRGAGGDPAGLAELAVRGLRDAQRPLERLSRLECGPCEAPKPMTADDRLGVYVVGGEPLDREGLLEAHRLRVRAGLLESEVDPRVYTPPRRVEAEYALLVGGEPVETGAYPRLVSTRGVLEGCGIVVEVERGSVRIGAGGENLEYVMPETPLAARLASLYVDAVVSAALSCRPLRGADSVVEAVDGPLIAWRRFVTPPLAYNVYSESLGGISPLQRLLECNMCIGGEAYRAVAAATAMMYASCCGVELYLKTGGKVFVQTLYAPRVTA